MTNAPDAREAWSDYWRGQKGGCLPESAASTLDKAFRDEWQREANTLPPSARVLDLATGDAVVLRSLRHVRSDLALIGIDLADPIPEPPPGISTRGGVAMETLPFGDAHFDAVVSQFGFEYGDIDASAGEVARVLKPGGRLTLVTHHADGPIVAHNLKRATGLRWALDESKLVEMVRDSTVNGRAAIDRAPELAIAQFGRGSAGWQLAEAIRRSVAGAGIALDRQASAMIDRLERMARGEIRRIDALVVAATVASEPARLRDALRGRGLDLVDEHPIMHPPDGRIVAMFRAFCRR